MFSLVMLAATLMVFLTALITGFDQPAVLIALIVGIVAPFILKYFPSQWKGTFMALIVFALSVLLAFVILLVTGGTSGWTWQNVGAEVAVLYATTQLVFSAFKSALNLPDPGPPAPVIARP